MSKNADGETGLTADPNLREIYASPNGDRWYLTRDASASPRVTHVANAPSGGAVTEFEIDTFLSTNGRHTPQHQGLLELIATLVIASEQAGPGPGRQPTEP